MESKPELLIISPKNEINFVGPFDRPNRTTISLVNPNDKTVFFKIKSNAPKDYSVKPICSKILPFETAEVEICLNPFKYEPNKLYKHKFMVLSIHVPEDCAEPIKMLSAMNSNEVVKSRIDVVFEMPGDVKEPNDKSNEDLIVDRSMKRKTLNLSEMTCGSCAACIEFEKAEALKSGKWKTIWRIIWFFIAGLFVFTCYFVKKTFEQLEEEAICF